MMEGMHVFSRRVLQLTNESSMMGGTFKYKEKKLGVLYFMLII
jgi:hypothetical protein